MGELVFITQETRAGSKRYSYLFQIEREHDTVESVLVWRGGDPGTGEFLYFCA